MVGKTNKKQKGQKGQKEHCTIHSYVGPERVTCEVKGSEPEIYMLLCNIFSTLYNGSEKTGDILLGAMLEFIRDYKKELVDGKFGELMQDEDFIEDKFIPILNKRHMITK